MARTSHLALRFWTQTPEIDGRPLVIGAIAVTLGVLVWLLFRSPSTDAQMDEVLVVATKYELFTAPGS
jgi:hypothetical protein